MTENNQQERVAKLRILEWLVTRVGTLAWRLHVAINAEHLRLYGACEDCGTPRPDCVCDEDSFAAGEQHAYEQVRREEDWR